MACHFPVGTYRLDRSLTYRPCGQCLGCRLDYSLQWAIRCHHESTLYKQNSFLTLTYNDDHLPKDGSLKKSHVQKFIKKLRKEVYPTLIRYFGSGEYGEQFTRPHYHLIIFGYDFNDKTYFKSATPSNYFSKKINTPLYISEKLSKIWDKGFHIIGEVNFQSAAYVARYVTKKVNGKDKDIWYDGKTPEFALMSRMPGIGKPWFDKYSNDCYPKDFVTINGRKFPTPRYYDSLYGKKFPEVMEKLKQKRREYADSQPYVPDRRKMQKERHQKSITKQLERKIEHGNY